MPFPSVMMRVVRMSVLVLAVLVLATRGGDEGVVIVAASTAGEGGTEGREGEEGGDDNEDDDEDEDEAIEVLVAASDKTVGVVWVLAPHLFMIVV